MVESIKRKKEERSGGGRGKGVLGKGKNLEQKYVRGKATLSGKSALCEEKAGENTSGNLKNPVEVETEH